MNPEEMREKAEAATGLLKALANRNRLMILCQLVECECSVGDLAKRLDLRDTVVSQHLGLLRRDGLVAPRRDGQTIYYSLQGEEAGKVLQTLYEIYCVADVAQERTMPAAGRDAPTSPDDDT